VSEKKRPLQIRATPWKTSTEEKVAGALGELPAYVRRDRAVEEAIERFHATLAAERIERLEITALKVRRLVDLGEKALRAHDDLDHDALAELRKELEPLEAYRRVRARAPEKPRAADVKRALTEVRRSVQRFNTAWDLRLADEESYAQVNERIEGYNRWYAFERQCALKHVPISQVRFAAIAPVTAADAGERHPTLSCP